MHTRNRNLMVIGLGAMGVMVVALALAPGDPNRTEDPRTRVEVAPLEIPQASHGIAGRGASPKPVHQPSDTDSLVRAAVAQLSRHPQLTSWLVTDGLARRLVAAVEAVADGYSPRDELAFARPSIPLFVTYEGTQAMITDASFRRYDVAAEVVESLDQVGLAAAYRRLRPRLEAIHGELPFARGELHARVLEAIDHLLEVDIPEAPYAVARRTRTWAFADPVLEGMSDAQRHLLRMGPRNATKIQGSLRRLREALESAAAVSATTSGPSDRPAAASTAVYQDGLEASRSSTP